MSHRHLRDLFGDQRGASALEFGLFAPLLVFGLLAMVDVGIGLGTRMELDRVVRSGAQAAISLNNDAAAIRTLVLASSATQTDLEVDVAQVCTCAAVPAGCTALCPDGTAPSVYFEIQAQRQYAGMLFGERGIVSSTRVKIR
jgi:Flp pilus assembly protein TadG